MSREDILNCLDMLAQALTDHDHQWTEEQRSSYERCAASLGATSGCKAIDSSALS